MRCSYSEPRLDAYVDGTLAERERASVAVHLARCERCHALLDELRVIDALLIAPRRLEPAPTFTFGVMAEVRALPVPHQRRTPRAAVLGTYVVFAWATIGAFLVWGGASAHAMLAWLVGSGRQGGVVFGELAVVTGHLFGRSTPDVTAAMSALLGADLVLAGAIVAFYALRRTGRTSEPW